MEAPPSARCALPLLQQSLACFRTQAQCYLDSDDECEMGGHVPFMVDETRNSRPGPRLRVTGEEAWEMLAGVRTELEVR